jgi:hypothetical protein
MRIASKKSTGDGELRMSRETSRREREEYLESISNTGLGPHR